MHYAICNSDNENSPYQVLSFTSLASMKDCQFIDEYSMVYSTKEPKQLIDNWQQDELEGTWLSILLNSKKAHNKFSTDLTTYRNMKNKFQNKEIAAQKLHELVLFCVKPWKKENQMNEAVEVTTIHVDEFNNKAQKAEKEVRPRFEKTTKIVALMDTPPIRSGTNRYRNMEVVMGCATVAEAMEKLRALDPAPGGGVDIKIAVKAGAVKLEE
tara:strand:+ start:705 stop:1340 length:636 start_codon:yes stop_codon:yes gene_type:complete